VRQDALCILSNADNYFGMTVAGRSSAKLPRLFLADVATRPFFSFAGCVFHGMRETVARHAVKQWPDIT